MKYMPLVQYRLQRHKNHSTYGNNKTIHLVEINIVSVTLMSVQGHSKLKQEKQSLVGTKCVHLQSDKMSNFMALYYRLLQKFCTVSLNSQASCFIMNRQIKNVRN